MAEHPFTFESDRRYSRRQVLGGGLALGAAGAAVPLLSACGSSSGSGKGGSSVAGTIDFLSWVAYDLRFSAMNNLARTQHHINMTSTYISTTTPRSRRS